MLGSQWELRLEGKGGLDLRPRATFLAPLKPSFPHLQKGDRDSICLRQLTGLKETM